MNSAIDQLLEIPPFEIGKSDAPFLAAVNECLGLLRNRFPAYGRFLDDRLGDKLTEPLMMLDQVRELPAIFLPVLKQYGFEPREPLPISVRLTSSGTTGNPSIIPQDVENMQRRVHAMANVYRAMGILTREVRALCFLLDPATTRMAGSLVIDSVLRISPEVENIHYLARQSPSGPQFETEDAVAALKSSVEEGPVLIVGYPALIAVAIQKLVAAGFSEFPLPEGSVILTGGGWKSFLPGVSLDQQEFRERAAAFFQLSPGSIRDMFGLSECPAVMLQCEQGRYHIPQFAWAQAVDPETALEVSAGEVGLLQLTVPLTTCYPLLKILTTDKVEIASGCSCGSPAPCLTPHGRVTAARFETCAMKIGQAVG